MNIQKYQSKNLEQFLIRRKISTLKEMKAALGTDADMTVFRKLKQLSYRSSYSHGGRYYTLDKRAKFDDKGKISREKVSGFYLYCAADASMRRQQLLARRVRLSDAGDFSDEVKAAIILFVSILDEQQRRLFAGLESLKLGHGGDLRIADLLGLHPQTVAKGRRELIDRDIVVDRTRKKGAGRKPVEKKHRK